MSFPDDDGPSDADLCEMAAELWQLPSASYRVGVYGAGVCLLADLADGTTRIMAGIDHREARAWLTLLLRSDHIAREVEQLAAIERASLPPQQSGPKSTRPMRPTRPRVAQPYLPSPSAPPPDDLSAALDFAIAPRDSLPPPTSATPDDHHHHAPHASAAVAPLEPGGGSFGGAGATGAWSESSSTSSTSSDSGTSSDGGGSSDSGSGGGND